MNKLFAVVVLLTSLLAFGQVGPIPPGMPTKLGVGLFEDTGRTWMKSSGVPWQIRYRYFTYKWSSNWGFGPKDGAFAGQFFRDSDTQGYIPAVQYYEIFDLPPVSTGQLAKMRNTAAMAEYFADFKILMQQAKTFGKPVLVLVEADATGFLQAEVDSNPNALAAVASTGLPELASLPNTAAGWGMAFLQLRKTVGASNVILGIHVSGWASGQDLFHSSTSVPLQPAVDKVANFLSPLGLAANITGQTYDLLVMDPLDRDAEFYKLTAGEDRWWDPSDSASVNTKSFNRYAEWLRLWNLKTNKRIVLWQIPIGNANSLNVCNAGKLNQGYKDNRVAYFFGTDSAPHRKLFVASGVIALLFGAGQSCQASFEIDGNILRNAAATFFSAGGLVLPVAAVPVVDAGTPVVDAGVDAGCVCVCPTPDAGTPVVDAGRLDAGTPIVDAGKPPIDAGAPVLDAGLPSGDTAQYNFEDGALGQQGFTSNGTLVRSSVQSFAGKWSLGANLVNQSETVKFTVANPAIPRGAIVVFHAFLPAGIPIVSAQVFVQETQATAWKWTASWYPATQLVSGWNTFTLAVPSVPGTLQALGLEFQLSAPYTGSIYVDTISWGAGTAIDSGSISEAPRLDSGVVDSGTFDAGSARLDAGVGPVTGSLMPLGDSITAEEWAWRCELSKRLPGIAFVGSVTNQYDVACAPKHEGHPGFTIGDISNGLNGWLTAYRPGIVAVMAGTNDLAWWTAETGTSVANRLDKLVTTIQDTLPGVRIVVATIPPQSSSIIAPNNVDRALLTQQFNAQVRLLVAARVAAGQRIRLAEVNGALTLADLRDGIHPTVQAGIAKIAPVLYSAVQQVTAVP